MKTAADKRRKSLCCLCIVITILLLLLLFLILAFTVFKPKHPTTVVNSTSVSNLRFNVVPFPNPRVSLNVTLNVNVTVGNPNAVGFKYTDSTAYLRYRGEEVGSVPIEAGEIGGKSEKNMNLTLTLMADRLLGSSEFYTDAINGAIPLQTYIRISGKVKILVSVKVVAYATCDLVVDMTSRSVVNQTCRYRTKV